MNLKYLSIGVALLLSGCEKDYKIEHLNVHSNPTGCYEIPGGNFYYCPDISSLDDPAIQYSTTDCSRQIGFTPEIGINYTLTVSRVPNLVPGQDSCGFKTVLMSIEVIKPDLVGTRYPLYEAKIQRKKDHEPWFTLVNAVSSQLIYCPDKLCGNFVTGQIVELHPYTLEKIEVDGKLTLGVVLNN